jgi:ABC-type uncharacterized transport system permease subunit
VVVGTLVCLDVLSRVCSDNLKVSDVLTLSLLMSYIYIYIYIYIYKTRTASLTYRRILYVYSTNIRSEYFIHAAHYPPFSLQNAVCFIIIPFLVHVLFTFYIQGVIKFKNKFGRLRVNIHKPGLTLRSLNFMRLV